MDITTTDFILSQIDELLDRYGDMENKLDGRHSDLRSGIISEFLTAGKALLHRMDSKNGPYITEFEERREQLLKRLGDDYGLALSLFGILRALRHDVSAGNLTSVQELIHANMFADFLGMAQHLLEEGYKDPAAVLIGGVLEEHLRKLCLKNDIPIEVEPGRPKRAGAMNADLARENVYSGLDQKSVTSWLGLRNKAAHGEYDAYTGQQVSFLLQQVQDFLTRHPA